MIKKKKTIKTKKKNLNIEDKIKIDTKKEIEKSAEKSVEIIEEKTGWWS